MSAVPAGNRDTVIRTLEAAGFPPGQARDLAARIREEVRRWPPLSDEQRDRLRALLDCGDGDPDAA